MTFVQMRSVRIKLMPFGGFNFKASLRPYVMLQILYFHRKYRVLNILIDYAIFDSDGGVQLLVGGFFLHILITILH